MTPRSKFEMSNWKSDIESFDRWMKFLAICTSKDGRRWAISHLNTIKGRWPALKNDEIPVE